jgi:hypothetical protein
MPRPVERSRATRCFAVATKDPRAFGIDGINAWTRVKVDGQRIAHGCIVKMREAGELATEDSGRPKKARAERGLILRDLIGSRATERASAWRKQAALFDVDLDDAEENKGRRRSRRCPAGSGSRAIDDSRCAHHLVPYRTRAAALLRRDCFAGTAKTTMTGFASADALPSRLPTAV